MALPVRIEHAEVAARRVLMVDWHLGNTCNYACSYCPASIHDGSRPWHDRDVVMRFCDRAAAHARDRGQTLYVKFTGGEPTLCPYFLDLVAHIKAGGGGVGLNSNGSRGRKFWSKARESLDVVFLTLHAEFVPLDHFVANIRTVAEKTRVHVNIAMMPERFDECLAAARRIAAECTDVTLTLKLLLVDFADKPYPYTDAQRATLRDLSFDIPRTRPRVPPKERGMMRVFYDDGTAEQLHSSQLLSRGETRFVGWSCHVGLEMLMIKFNGAIFRANCLQGGKLGHIADEAFAFPGDPVICKKLVCACLADIRTTRTSPRYSGASAPEPPAPPTPPTPPTRPTREPPPARSP